MFYSAIPKLPIQLYILKLVYSWFHPRPPYRRDTAAFFFVLLYALYQLYYHCRTNLFASILEYFIGPFTTLLTKTAIYSVYTVVEYVYPVRTYWYYHHTV
jgi:hypothetical protein